MSISQINNYESKVQPVLRPALSRYMATHCVAIKNSKKIESLIEEIPFRETYSRNSFQHRIVIPFKKEGSFLLDLPVLEFSL
ncbi:hypothetical protein LEP1GSC082_3963 [Leptospira kirschneri str. H2]|nr:hypothetical protein LEP1GSC082_3963 [Leptospira kirschneri str. H2]